MVAGNTQWISLLADHRLFSVHMQEFYGIMKLFGIILIVLIKKSCFIMFSFLFWYIAKISTLISSFGPPDLRIILPFRFACGFLFCSSNLQVIKANNRHSSIRIWPHNLIKIVNITHLGPTLVTFPMPYLGLAELSSFHRNSRNIINWSNGWVKMHFVAQRIQAFMCYVAETA